MKYLYNIGIPRKINSDIHELQNINNISSIID